MDPTTHHPGLPLAVHSMYISNDKLCCHLTPPFFPCKVPGFHILPICAYEVYKCHSLGSSVRLGYYQRTSYRCICWTFSQDITNLPQVTCNILPQVLLVLSILNKIICMPATQSPSKMLVTVSHLKTFHLPQWHGTRS